MCSVLLDGNFQTSDKQAMSTKTKIICPKAVQAAAEIIEELIS
jgi:hypothetical protein